MLFGDFPNLSSFSKLGIKIPHNVVAMIDQIDQALEDVHYFREKVF